MSCRRIWPRWATPTTVTTVQAAHAATARYVAGGPARSWVGWGVSVMKDQGPRCPGSGPMMICTAPPSMGLAIMLRCGDSPATTLRVSASLIAPSPPSLSDRPHTWGVSLLFTLVGRCLLPCPMPCLRRAVARPGHSDRRHRHLCTRVSLDHTPQRTAHAMALPTRAHWRQWPVPRHPDRRSVVQYPPDMPRAHPP